MIEQRRLAGTEKASKHCHRNGAAEPFVFV
jgi:hypothetical protein